LLLRDARRKKEKNNDAESLERIKLSDLQKKHLRELQKQ
jgi:hypothetical protein